MTLLERERETLTAAPSRDEFVRRLCVLVEEELVAGAWR